MGLLLGMQHLLKKMRLLPLEHQAEVAMGGEALVAKESAEVEHAAALQSVSNSASVQHSVRYLTG